MAQRTERDRDEEPRGIFATFFMAGFECSTFLWKDGQRKDYIALTGHDRHLDTVYASLKNLGISSVREGVAWPAYATPNWAARPPCWTSSASMPTRSARRSPT